MAQMEQMRSRNAPQQGTQYQTDAGGMTHRPGSFGASNKQGGVLDDLDMSQEFISYLNGGAFGAPEFTQDQVDGKIEYNISNTTFFISVVFLKAI